MQLMIHEILEKVAEAKTKQEKIDILRQNNSLALRDILRGGFDDMIEFILPAGAPSFEVDDAPAGYTRSALQQQTKKFRYFVKGGPGEQLQPARRERMFVEVLESIHPKESELVVRMKDKKFIVANKAYYKGLTKALVKEAFPNLIKI